jgi:hypothetical protein
MHTRHSSSALVRLTCKLLGAGLLIFSMLAFAGPATPPLELIFSNEARLVGAELVEISPAGRLVFKREKVFGRAADVPDFIDVAGTARALDTAQVGKHYIFAYTRLGYDKQYPEGVTPSRKGTILISSLGLDPALFMNTRELRSILQLASTEKGRESRKLHRLLLNTFSEDAPALQRLAAGQFALDTEMSSKLTVEGRSVLKSAALNEKINPTTQSLLITAAADRPNDFGPWAADAITKVLEFTPVDGYPDGAADHTGLVLLCFDEASNRGFQVPFKTLARWLRSSQQLYLERAARLIEKLYAERRKSAFENALGEASPDSATRRFLEGKLRDLNRRDAVGDAHAH